MGCRADRQRLSCARPDQGYVTPGARGSVHRVCASHRRGGPAMVGDAADWSTTRIERRRLALALGGMLVGAMLGALLLQWTEDSGVRPPSPHRWVICPRAAPATRPAAGGVIGARLPAVRDRTVGESGRESHPDDAPGDGGARERRRALIARAARGNWPRLAPASSRAPRRAGTPRRSRPSPRALGVAAERSRRRRASAGSGSRQVAG